MDATGRVRIEAARAWQCAQLSRTLSVQCAEGVLLTAARTALTIYIYICADHVSAHVESLGATVFDSFS